MTMTVSPRSQQINTVLSPHLPPPLTNIIISYKTIFDDEETMETLNYLVKNLSGKVKMNPSEDGYDLAIAMVNKLYQALKEENFFNSCVANTKMTPVEQIELAKRYSILRLTHFYSRKLRLPIQQMTSIDIYNAAAWQFYEQIPERLTWVFARKNSPKELNENNLATLVEHRGNLIIVFISSFDPIPFVKQ